jgi:menaquinone-9 beta-reductase
MSNIDASICIIGAGPAGAITSLFLSKKKIPHVIVDAANFPRDKVCGDALDLKVLRVLNQLDPSIVANEILPNANFAKAWGCSVIVSKDKKYNLDLDPSPNGYPFFMTCKRAYFDNFLAQKIASPYALFLQGTKVKKLSRAGVKWKIEASNEQEQITINADLVVGADGDHSAVLRSVGERKIDRVHYVAALRQYWKGVSGLNPNNHIEIYLPKSLPLAYLWIFPLPNGEANVGCGLQSELIAKKKIDLKKLFQELINEDAVIADRFKNATPLEKPVGWGLPFASGKRRVYGDGYLLTGDAAAMICPTTGEGVGPAMISGVIAAHYIEKAVQQNRFDKEVFAGYDTAIYKRLEADIKKYNLLRHLWPTAYNSLIRIFSGLGISRYYFNKNVDKWIETAKSKPIEV